MEELHSVSFPLPMDWWRRKMGLLPQKNFKFRNTYHQIWLKNNQILDVASSILPRWTTPYCKVSCIAPWSYMIFCSPFGGYIRGACLRGGNIRGNSPMGAIYETFWTIHELLRLYSIIQRCLNEKSTTRVLDYHSVSSAEMTAEKPAPDILFPEKLFLFCLFLRFCCSTSACSWDSAAVHLPARRKWLQ